MERILCVIAIVMMATGANAMSDWPRTYATTLVRGHVRNLPEDVEQVSTSIYAGLADENIIGETLTYEGADSVGTFRMKMNMCWPSMQSLAVCGVRFDLPLSPGDTIDIYMDYQEVENLKTDSIRMPQEAIRTSGTARTCSPQYLALVSKLNADASRLDMDYIRECGKAGFNAYRDGGT